MTEPTPAPHTIPLNAFDIAGRRGDFAGRTALVTGAASGIGAACALRLAAAGATMRALDLDAVGLDALGRRAKGLPGSVEAVVLDLCDLGAAEHVAAAGTDILVNNAGCPKGLPHRGLPARCLP